MTNHILLKTLVIAAAEMGKLTFIERHILYHYYDINMIFGAQNISHNFLS